jgi:prepilin-type N-terminal cleavage/methylation domain-containing protein
MNKPFKTAFTLIELLVVIAIIGILSGFVVVSMNGSINSANDAKRKAGIDTIRKASIYAHSLGILYPTGSSCNVGPSGTTPAPACNFSSVSEFLPNIPVDPISGVYYKYSSTNGTNFIISTNLSTYANYNYSSSLGFNAVFMDDFSNNDSVAYTADAYKVATWTWDTANKKVIGTNDGYYTAYYRNTKMYPSVGIYEVTIKLSGDGYSSGFTFGHPGTSNAGMNVLVTRHAGTGKFGFWCLRWGGTDVLGFQVTTVNNDSNNHRVKIVVSATTIMYYFDGVYVATQTIPLAYQVYTIGYIGLSTYYGGGEFSDFIYTPSVAF